MFEFQIGISQDKAKIAKKIYDELKLATKDFDAVLTKYNQNKKTFVVIACEDLEKPRISFIISDIISDIITTFYKLEFIEQKLMLPVKNSVNLCAFKKALVAFDKETDKYIVARNLKIEKTLYIDEFFEFRLKQLRSKWMEIIKMANDNAGYLLCSDTFIDLLKFLIENIEISRETVNILKKDRKYVICDEQLNEIDKNDYCLSCDDESVLRDENVDLITSLISLSPKKIIVHCSLFENNPALTLISQIFESRISIDPAEKN